MLGREMNPILLISTYNGSRERGDNDAIRKTYLKEWGHLVPHTFIYDRTGRALQCDEIAVPSPVGFMNGAFKTRDAIRWALYHDHDYAFIVPTDCYVIVPRLLDSGYERHDYTGYQVPDEGHIGGGSGYWLSKRAMEIVARSEPELDYEDRWVGKVLRENGITLVHDPRYWDRGQPYQEGIITAHLSRATGVYDPEWMYNQHEIFWVRNRDGK